MSRRPLREWQERFTAHLASHEGPSYLLDAAPGAGKTVATANAVTTLWTDRALERLIVVCPTTTLRLQWAAALAPWGIHLDCDFENAHASIAPDMHGVVVTYQQVAAASALFAMLSGRKRTMVVLDEIHHAGDQRSWGRAVADAFEPCVMRLGLSGTPFRQDKAPIPFVTYTDVGYAKPDFSYGYAASLRDGVCRPVEFVLRDAEATWEYGEETHTATFEDYLDPVDAARRLRTVVSPRCSYMTDVLDRADERLSEIRQGKPDAGGLVLAETQAQAREIAMLLEQSTGERPAVALSDDKGADEAITAFSASDQRWIVAVRKISEGTDVPRLCVEVWATRWRAELFFRQAVGRVVRRQATDAAEFAAVVFLPADPQLRELAQRVEAEVTYKVDEGLDPLHDTELKTDGVREDRFVPVGATPGDQEVIIGGRRYSHEQVEHARKVMKALGHANGDLGLYLARMADAGVLPGTAQRGAAMSPVPTADGDGESRAQLKKRVKAAVDALVREWGTFRELTEPDFRWGFARADMNRAIGVPAISQATAEQLAQAVEWLKDRLASCAAADPLLAAEVAAERRAHGKPTYLGQLVGETD